MQFKLKEISQKPVGKRSEEQYLYESEDGKLVVQFYAGKKAWTFLYGEATNAAGREHGLKVIEEFLRVQQEALSNSQNPNLNQLIQTLEVSL